MVSVETVEGDKCPIITADGASGPTQNDDRSCKVCGVGPCTNRCSLCKQVYYCSVDCQRTDWTKGGHRKNCVGRKKKPNKKKSSIIGPSIPPPTSVRNEEDAKRALQELWSITESAMQEEIEKVTETKTSGKTKIRNQQPAPSRKEKGSNSKPSQKSKSKSKTSDSDSGNKQQQQETNGDEVCPLSEEHKNNNNNNNNSFVVEEMPQICRFQLTLTIKQTNHEHFIQNSSIHVSATPIGRAKSRTLVKIRENDKNRSLFVGEFSKPIQSSDITWRVSPVGEKETKDAARSFVIVVRLPYPYDPSNTSSLALGGSIDTSYYNSTMKDATLDEINTVVCGACHLPLVPSTTTPPIYRVFPLPQGHWDEIADYLICYDGQPVVDFSAGSECAEPSIVLQDASLLCFHRKDVQQAICALAVDGYGELSESPDESIETDENSDLGSFFTTKPSSASTFVLPNPPKEESNEEKKDTDPPNSNTNSGEPEISATSAVIRGDRTWQDATDGESVSLCCSRCCSPLGFASLGSPETWRFWKHRLSVQVKAETTRENDERSTRTNKTDDNISNFAATVSFATNTIPALTTTTKPRISAKTILPVIKPLASCSSFLARELVRYAESKAIFTFVVRKEVGCDQIIKNNECLLLRLLGWESAMATSYLTNQTSNKEKSKTLLFQKVAKIVFEVTTDPTIARETNSKHHGNNNNNNSKGETPTQWFWGGVDLCCPPPDLNNKTKKNNKNKTSNLGIEQTEPPPDVVSSARLQLPTDEYDLVLEDLISGKALFEPEIAKATILLKMGGLSKGLGLTAVTL